TAVCACCSVVASIICIMVEFGSCLASQTSARIPSSCCASLGDGAGVIGFSRSLLIAATEGACTGALGTTCCAGSVIVFVILSFVWFFKAQTNNSSNNNTKAAAICHQGKALRFIGPCFVTTVNCCNKAPGHALPWRTSIATSVGDKKRGCFFSNNTTACAALSGASST